MQPTPVYSGARAGIELNLDDERENEVTLGRFG
jgi:hypothetical protein